MSTVSQFDRIFWKSLDINKNVYEGNDYLPEIYSQWMAEKNRDNFVILNSSNDVVGFFSLSNYEVDDYKVFVEQALRLRADILGNNLSKLVIQWVDKFIKKKSTKALLLSVACFHDHDASYEQAMETENQNRIHKYMRGSDTRNVLDIGLFVEVAVNDYTAQLLRTSKKTLQVIDTNCIFTELKSMDFCNLPKVKKYNAHILKQYWYPFMINHSSSMDKLFNPVNSPVLNNMAQVRALRSDDVFSIGALCPTGVDGKWIVSIDVYGESHEDYIDHLKEHFTFFEQSNRDIFNIHLNLPNIDQIEKTEFNKELSKVKKGPVWFTPVFFNDITQKWINLEVRFRKTYGRLYSAKGGRDDVPIYGTNAIRSQSG